MSYAKDTQSRKWTLVINNPEEHGLTIEMIIELLNLFHPDYFCLAAEISSTFHLYGCIPDSEGSFLLPLQYGR